MLDLYLLNETFTNGSNHGLLTFVSLASIFCGIFVIVSKNPIVSVLFLIGLFLNIAGYLMLLGINFIGLSYLLVYVGLVFILLLIIIHLATPSEGIKHEVKLEVKPELDVKEGQPNLPLNLVHCNMINSRGQVISNRQFVWDKNDPTGMKLRPFIFPITMKLEGTGYGAVVHNSAQGWDGNARLLMANIPSSRVITAIANDGSIQTNGLPAVIIPSENNMSRIHIQENV